MPTSECQRIALQGIPCEGGTLEIEAFEQAGDDRKFAGR